jgi:hypothetical protein
MTGQKTMADPMTAGDEHPAVAAPPHRSSARKHDRRSPRAVQSDVTDDEGADHRGGEEDCRQQTLPIRTTTIY